MPWGVCCISEAGCRHLLGTVGWERPGSPHRRRSECSQLHDLRGRLRARRRCVNHRSTGATPRPFRMPLPTCPLVAYSYMQRRPHRLAVLISGTVVYTGGFTLWPRSHRQCYYHMETEINMEPLDGYSDLLASIKANVVPVEIAGEAGGACCPGFSCWTSLRRRSF